MAGKPSEGGCGNLENNTVPVWEREIKGKEQIHAIYKRGEREERECEGE